MTAPTVLEYARHYNLAQPSTIPDHISCIKPYPISESSTKNPILFNVKCPVLGQRLELSGEGMRYLAQTTTPPFAVTWNQIHDEASHRRDVKLDTPLLVRDHAKDLRWFRKGLNIERIIKELQDGRPRGALGDSTVEDFYKECSKAADAIHRVICNARFHAPKYALETLSRCIEREHTIDSSKLTWDLPQKRQTIPEDAPTPLLATTLSPTEPGAAPAVPSIDLEPLLGSPVDVDHLLLRVESSMHRDDQVCTTAPSFKSARKVQGALADSETSPQTPSKPLPGRMVWNLKPEESPETTLPEELVEATLSQRAEQGHVKDDLDELFDDFVNIDATAAATETVTPTSDSGNSQSKDQPNEEDTQTGDSHSEGLLHIDVATPRSPVYGGAYFQPLDALSICCIQPYELDLRLQSKLNWAPFAQLPTQLWCKESLDNTSHTQSYLKVPEKVLSSRDLLWKQPGLRLLDDDSEGDEEIKVDADLFSSLSRGSQQLAGQKRHSRDEVNDIPSSLQLASVSNDTQLPLLGTSAQQPPINSEPCPDVEQLNKTQLGSFLDQPRKKRIVTNNALQNQMWERIATSFSATTALSSFLDLRAGKFKKTALPDTHLSRDRSISSQDAHHENSNDPIQSSQVMTTELLGSCAGQPSSVRPPDNTSRDPFSASQRTDSQSPDNVQVPATQSALTDSLTPALPLCRSLTEPRVIVLDERLVENRNLMAMLDYQDETILRCIYRKQESTPDIILSPKRCLVQTNLQQLKQKRLPGTKTSAASTNVQDRLRALSLDYEQIFILVGLPLSDTVALQQQTLTEFSCFCVSLQLTSPNLSVCPIWITLSASSARPPRSFAHGNVDRKPYLDPMTAWTWHLIHEHSQPVLPAMSFIDDTTVWELFLRQAGVNILAAQVMLGMLKRDHQDDAEGMESGGSLDDAASQKGRASNTESGLWGLRRLVSMTEQERKALFGDLVGEACLQRMECAFRGV